MKYVIALSLGLTIVATSGTAQAMGPFDRVKSRVGNAVERAAEEEVKKVLRVPSRSRRSRSSSSSSASRNVALGRPAANLRALTKCSALKPTNVVTGYVENYTFQQGMSQEKRSGMVKRQNGTVSDGCILPSLQSRQYAYMEVDTKKFKAMGSSNDWEMQCVKSANPGAGAVGQKEPKTEYPYRVNFLAGKDMMLHCGNSEGISECASGSNSSRSGAWDRKLKARGKTMLSILGVASTLAPSGGEKLYCQYYNKQSGTSLFGFEYLRKRN